MRLKPEQLAAALQKGLAPVYLISGDEPLQVGEAADAVRKKARESGFDSREIFSVEANFDWKQLTQASNSLSIFADKKIIDLRVPSGKLGTDGGKAINTYCQRPPEDTLLLMTAGKLPKEAAKSQWLQTVEKIGVVIQVWPLSGQDLIQWLQQRLQLRGLIVPLEGVKLLALRIEGNLLAAAQEVEKLYVLYGAASLSVEQIYEVVADSSRYDVFNLMDSVLAANAKRILKILFALQSEGIAAPIVLWALTRETRSLIKMKLALAQGQAKDMVFRNHQVFDKRKNLVSDALQRLSMHDLNQTLLLSAKADRQSKGQEQGDAWETLLQICLVLAAIEPLRLIA